MLTYKWQRFNALQRWYAPVLPTPTYPGGLTTTVQFAGSAKGYTWDIVSKSYTLSTAKWAAGEFVGSGGAQLAAYILSSGVLMRYTHNQPGVFYDDASMSMNVRSDQGVASNATAYYLQGATSSGTMTSTNRNAYPDNGHSGGFWYVYDGIVATAPTTPGEFTQPIGTLETGDVKVISWGASSDAESNLSKYVLEVAVNGGPWAVIAQPTSPTFSYTVPTATSVKFRVKAVDVGGLESVYRDSSAFPINSKPTLILNATNNRTLYENDTFLIDGTAKDSDIGSILNVYYRINGGLSRAIATGISTGASIPFNEQLTFKSGKLYKDAAAITDALAEGPAHRLEVWSEDNQGGKSTVAERTFYVVPNRAPALTVDPFTAQPDLINADTLYFSGTANDPDGNDVTVKYRVNTGLNTQIYNGPAGVWSFELPLSALVDGENTIVVEATDTYGFKTSRTLKLNKNANLTSLTTSTQRYKIVSPTGSAKGVLLWIQRDTSAVVSADISMTNGTEQEQFAAMTLNVTAPANGSIVEDEFYFESAQAAEHINVKLTLSGTGAVTLISGVLS